MKVSMPQGPAHGWGIAGTYLSREIAKLPPVPGVTLHCMRPSLEPLQPSDWDEINIGYCFFEDNLEILNHTRGAARSWDFVVAGSTWCEHHLRIGGVKKCCTILQGVDPANFSTTPLPPEDRFVVFSGGKFEFRKGQDLVIAAMRAFMQRHSDAWLSCIWANQWPFSLATMGASRHIAYRHDESDLIALPARTAVANGIDPGRLIAYPLIPNQEVHRAFAGTHLGLFPNRCEGGNNMVMCEYLACGRTVIASDGSGHADVITPDNAYPLTRYRPVVVHGQDGGVSAVWEEPEVEEIVELLEEAYRRRHDLPAKGARAAADMARLDWSAAARQFHYVATRLANEAELKKARR